MARNLRIAVSVFFGLLTVALCVLWVRSFWRMDQLFLATTRPAFIVSNNGNIICKVAASQYRWGAVPSFPWDYKTTTSSGYVLDGFWRSDAIETELSLSHLAMAIFPATIACLPWVRWKFSLRTLLIATTLVAVVLGLAVWASR